MHELSIAMSLLDAAEEEASRHDGARVAALHVRVGPLSGVFGAALRSAYELAREGSALAESELLIEETQIVLYCPACEAERPAESIQELRCSTCGTAADRIVGGQELELVALELAS
jgi:hydrogenase nickel incorporation protein HypA/HybF